MDTHQQRRQKLTSLFGNTLFILASGTRPQRTHSVKYKFKAHTDFKYLIGADIDGAIALVHKSKTQLFIKADGKDWDDDSFIWGASQLQGHDIEILKMTDFDEAFLNLCSQSDRLAATLNTHAQLDQKIFATLSFSQMHRQMKRRSPLMLCDSKALVGQLRAYKSEIEIAHLREANRRSSLVHNHLMQKNLVGLSEKQVSLWIEKAFLEQQIEWTSYETIVGSGDRSTVLHALPTEKIITENDLVLVDAGGEWESYCADITRTFSASHQFSQSQKDIYQIVLNTQKEILKLCKPGESLLHINTLTKEILKEEIAAQLGAKVTLDEMKTLMPHSTSHWLGLDVHDTAPYYTDNGEAIRLEESMSFTVEPGLYIRPSFKGLDKYKGLGVRIEDNVVITKSGHENLTSAAKEIDEISKPTP